MAGGRAYTDDDPRYDLAVILVGDSAALSVAVRAAADLQNNQSGRWPT
jgi:hypothetical protein